MKHASNITYTSTVSFFSFLLSLNWLLCVRYSLLFTIAKPFGPQTSKKYLERGHICETVPFQVVDCRLIGQGDWKSNIETLTWETTILCIK